jgi:hypothetical protein|mmetsp:Transcript_64150/g.106026  ORF Transcript_64150/g.106026 Transcript_64150/m.106026 type:complete len:221 (+) Transcript_64150:475-1137(+)
MRHMGMHTRAGPINVAIPCPHPHPRFQPHLHLPHSIASCMSILMPAPSSVQTFARAINPIPCPHYPHCHPHPQPHSREPPGEPHPLPYAPTCTLKKYPHTASHRFPAQQWPLLWRPRRSPFRTTFPSSDSLLICMWLCGSAWFESKRRPWPAIGVLHGSLTTFYQVTGRAGLGPSCGVQYTRGLPFATQMVGHAPFIGGDVNRHLTIIPFRGIPHRCSQA